MTTFELLNILSKDENKKEFVFVDEKRNIISKDGSLLRFHEMEIAYIYLDINVTNKIVIYIQPAYDELKKLKLKLIDAEINKLMCEKEELLKMYNSEKTEKV